MADNLQVFRSRNFGLATVMLRKNGDVASIGAVLGVDMPTGPSCVTGNASTVIGTGPGTWLVFSPGPDPAWALDLAARLPGASVSDQSGGYEILQLSGPSARAVLQKGAFIDLHPSAFGAGAAATTVIAHIGTVIWQPDESETFHVGLFRSFSASFHDWLNSVATCELSF